jgi:hypothetical protein
VGDPSFYSNFFRGLQTIRHTRVNVIDRPKIRFRTLRRIRRVTHSNGHISYDHHGRKRSYPRLETLWIQDIHDWCASLLPYTYPQPMTCGRCRSQGNEKATRPSYKDLVCLAAVDLYRHSVKVTLNRLVRHYVSRLSSHSPPDDLSARCPDVPDGELRRAFPGSTSSLRTAHLSLGAVQCWSARRSGYLAFCTATSWAVAVENS